MSNYRSQNGSCNLYKYTELPNDSIVLGKIDSFVYYLYKKSEIDKLNVLYISNIESEDLSGFISNMEDDNVDNDYTIIIGRSDSILKMNNGINDISCINKWKSDTIDKFKSIGFIPIRLQFDSPLSMDIVLVKCSNTILDKFENKGLFKRR